MTGTPPGFKLPPSVTGGCKTPPGTRSAPRPWFRTALTVLLGLSSPPKGVRMFLTHFCCVGSCRERGWGWERSRARRVVVSWDCTGAAGLIRWCRAGPGAAQPPSAAMRQNLFRAPGGAAGTRGREGLVPVAAAWLTSLSLQGNCPQGWPGAVSPCAGGRGVCGCHRGDAASGRGVWFWLCCCLRVSPRCVRYRLSVRPSVHPPPEIREQRTDPAMSFPIPTSTDFSLCVLLVQRVPGQDA